MSSSPLPYHLSRLWIVIADGEQVRGYVRVPGADIIASPSGPGEHLTWDLQPLAKFDLSAKSIEAFDPTRRGDGSVHESVGAARHLHEPRQTLRRRLKSDLAHEAAVLLNQAYAAKRFDELIVAAPPAWLGYLRPALAREVRAVIRLELPKDLAGLSHEKLQARMREILPDRAPDYSGPQSGDA